MVLVFCTLSHGALHLCKFLENISQGFQLTEQTCVHGGNGYVQRAINPKVGNQNYSSCVLHVDSWCFTFV